MDSCTISAPTGDSTASAGHFLTRSLYQMPITVLLSGELGAGKTTFVQGLAKGLGYEGHVTSPTYALEQRYQTPRGELLHLDLYRLSPADALTLLYRSDDHPGIRCVEWSERTSAPPSIRDRIIEVNIKEIAGAGILPAERKIDVSFRDESIPSRTDIEQWRRDCMLPTHICAHCDAVADYCDVLAERLTGDGRPLRPLLLRRSAELHDLLRFVDFRPGAAPPGSVNTDEELTLWATEKKRYDGLHHEEACALFLHERGYEAAARIVEVHGLSSRPRARETIEEDILFYADKRVGNDGIVTLEERFDDFRIRYRKGERTEEAHRWYVEVKDLEKKLFGNRVP